jgi:hypothetical protein
MLKHADDRGDACDEQAEQSNDDGHFEASDSLQIFSTRLFHGTVNTVDKQR